MINDPIMLGDSSHRTRSKYYHILLILKAQGVDHGEKEGGG